MRIEQRLIELGLELPPVPTPAANYANAVRTGNLLFLSGNVPVTAHGHDTEGQGRGRCDDRGRRRACQARRACITWRCSARNSAFDRVRRVVKLLGMVNAVPEYTEHSAVINGCSDLLVDIFGERHARSAVGVGSLPFGITVEIELIVEVE